MSFVFVYRGAKIQNMMNCRNENAIFSVREMKGEFRMGGGQAPGLIARGGVYPDPLDGVGDKFLRIGVGLAFLVCSILVAQSDTTLAGEVEGADGNPAVGLVVLEWNDNFMFLCTIEYGVMILASVFGRNEQTVV